MNRTKLRIQAACVLALVVLVGWPQFRSIRAITVWRESGPLAPRPEVADRDPRLVNAQGPGIVRVGYGSLRRSSAGRSTAGRARTGRAGYAVMPAVAAVGGERNAINCRARTSLNRPVAYARVLLRDVTTGRIEARATADAQGRCAFADVASSGYVIELLGANGAAIASSALVTIGDEQVRQADVLVSSERTLDAVFGDMRPGASEPVTRAAETGAQGIGQPAATNSPQQ